MMDVSRDVAGLKSALQQTSPDVVIHVKCLSRPESYLINVELTPDERKRVVFCWPKDFLGLTDSLPPA